MCSRLSTILPIYNPASPSHLCAAESEGFVAPKPELVKLVVRKTAQDSCSCVTRQMPKASSAFYALQVRSGGGASGVRYLYLRAHQESSESATSALFVAGVSPKHDETVLRELFTVFGGVSTVAVHPSKVCSTEATAILCQQPAKLKMCPRLNCRSQQSLSLTAQAASRKHSKQLLVARRSLYCLRSHKKPLA